MSNRPFRLSRTHYFVTVGVLVIVIAALSPRLMWHYDEWHYDNVLLPEAEEIYGFRAETILVDTGDGQERFAVTEIERGGAFERAGVNVGDAPVMFSHLGDKRAFCLALGEGLEKGSVQINFVRADQYGDDLHRYLRRTEIQPPSR